MKIFVLILLLQTELSLYKYYSKKLKIEEEEILNRSFKFSISYLKSLYFNINKKHPYFFINSEYYFFKDFHLLNGNIVFQRKIIDSVLNLREFLRIKKDTLFSSFFIKINPLISFKNLYFNLNYEILLYTLKNKREKIKSYETDFLINEIYLKNLKTGIGYIPFSSNIYIFFSSDLNNYLFTTLYLYLYKKNILPGAQIIFLFKNLDINFEYKRKTNFYIALKEFEDLIINLPFNLEKSVFERSSLLTFSINYLFKNLKISFIYRKIFEDRITLYYVTKNNFKTKSGEFLEKMNFKIELMERFDFIYEKFNNYMDFIHFSFKLNYKKIIFEPKVISIPLNKFFLFSSKIGYLYNRYYLYGEIIHPEKELYPLKKEVRIGIQKRF